MTPRSPVAIARRRDYLRNGDPASEMQAPFGADRRGHLLVVKLKTIRRVTVYADGSPEQVLLKQFVALGSNGDTITPYPGKGEHDSVDDPFSTVTGVRIELLVQPEVAMKILAYVDGSPLKNRAVAACMETVEVAGSEDY